MIKKKYKLDELLEGITDENLHKEIFTGKDVEQYPSREAIKSDRRKEMLKLQDKVKWDGNPADADVEHDAKKMKKRIVI